MTDQSRHRSAIRAIIASTSFRFSGWMTEYLYLPSLPLLAAIFATSRKTLQFSLVVFLLGIFFSQLIGGKIASVAGSRRALIVKLLIAVGGTIVVLLAHSVETLIGGRFIQGFGVGLGFSLSYVLIHDAFGAETGKDNRTMITLSYLGMAAVWYPSLAMIVGAHVYEAFGWRANFFLLLALYSAQMGVLVWLLPPDEKGGSRYQFSEYFREFRRYWHCLQNRAYRRYVFSRLVSGGGIPAYYLSSTFIYRDYYGISVVSIAYFSLCPIVGQIAGMAFNIGTRRVLSRPTSMVLGFSIALVGALAMVVASPLVHSPLALLLPFTLFAVGKGVIPPHASAEVLRLFPHQAESAQSLMSALGTLSGAVFSFIAIFFHPSSPISLALLLLGLSVCALTIFVAAGRRGLGKVN